MNASQFLGIAQILAADGRSNPAAVACGIHAVLAAQAIRTQHALIVQMQAALESCGAAAVQDGGQQWYDDKLVEAALEAGEAYLSDPEAGPLQDVPNADSQRARYAVNLYLTRKLVQALESCTKHSDAHYEALEAGRKWLADTATASQSPAAGEKMTARELADRVARGERWRIAPGPQVNRFALIGDPGAECVRNGHGYWELHRDGELVCPLSPQSRQFIDSALAAAKGAP